MVQACPAASGKVRYLKQQKSALDPILLVTKNDFLRLTPWGLEPSPCPCGHPKKAFLGWFVEHLLSSTPQIRAHIDQAVQVLLILLKPCLFQLGQ